MRTVTDSQFKIIKSLGRYMFLTVDLINKLQIFKHKVSIYRSLQPLKEGSKPLVVSQSFGIHPRHGQLPALLYLSKYGKELLIECGYDEYKIKLPKNKVLVANDYFHRVSNLSFFVIFDLYLKSKGGHIIFLDYYFSKVNNVKSRYAQAKNRIELEDNKYIIPDIVTKFSIDQKKYLYLVEIHNGKDSNKAFTQILQHINAINLGTPKEKYKHPKNNRVIWIFEYESCMFSVMKKMNDNPNLKKYINLFLFKTMNSNEGLFENDWLNFRGELCKYI